MDFYECMSKLGSKFVVRPMEAGQDASPPKPHTLIAFYIEDGLRLALPVPVDMAEEDAVLHALIEHDLLMPGDLVGKHGDEHVIESSSGVPVMRLRLDPRPFEYGLWLDIESRLSDEHWAGLSPR